MCLPSGKEELRFSSHWSPNSPSLHDDPHLQAPHLWKDLASAALKGTGRAMHARVDCKACLTRVPHVIHLDVLEALVDCDNRNIFLSKHIQLPLTGFWYQYVYKRFLFTLVVNLGLRCARKPRMPLAHNP
jgi:hypothetical protein